MKVLYVNGGLMDRGGISAMMMNYYRHIEPEKIQIDFLVHGFEEGVHDEEIISRGSKIYHVVPKSIDFKKNTRQLKEIFTENRYDIIHAHADVGNAHILKIAKSCGISIRISHSHSTSSQSTGMLRKILGELQRKMVKRYATHYFGCSKAACAWLYGKAVNSVVIPNAIDAKVFSFDANKRAVMREQLMLGDSLALCQIGHLNTLKNQTFSIRVVHRLQSSHPDSNIKLILIGDGDQKKLNALASQLNVQDKICFLGQRHDISDILQACDVLLLPSLFEGLPVTLIEAQAADVPCLVSDKVSTEAAIIPGKIQFLPIDEDGVDLWCDVINTFSKQRRNVFEQIKDAGYDIFEESKKLCELYLSLVEKRAKRTKKQ